MKTLLFSVFMLLSIYANANLPPYCSLVESDQVEDILRNGRLEDVSLGIGCVEEASLAPKWWKIARADIAGAAAGVKVGGLFGGVGACIGAVVGGCIGSIAESGMVAPSNNTGSTTFNNAANRSNPYDNIGRLHYVAIDGIFAKPAGIIAPDGTINTVNYYGWMKNFVATNDLGTAAQLEQYYPHSAMVQDLASTRELTDLTTFINGLVSRGKMSQDEANVLIPYFTNMESASSFEAFKSYSVGVENQINASTKFSEASKAALLSVMATSRYGTAFWGVFQK